MSIHLIPRSVRPGAGATPTDAELLGRFAGGRDADAFEQLVARHGPMVWAVCRRSVSDHQPAEDVFQAVFLALARRAGGIRRGASLAGWLHKVARETAAAARQRFARRRQHEGGAWDAEPAGRSSPVVEDRETMSCLDAELARLSCGLREAFLLREVQGLSSREAAARLGCSEQAVDVRLHRARRSLAGRLSRRGLAASVLVVPGGLTAQAVRLAVLSAAGRAVPAAVASLAARAAGSALNKFAKPLAAVVVAVALAAGVGLSAPPAAGPAAFGRQAAISRDGRRLAVGRSGSSPFGRKHIDPFDLDAGKRIARFGSQPSVMMSFSPDGGRLARLIWDRIAVTSIDKDGRTDTRAVNRAGAALAPLPTTAGTPWTPGGRSMLIANHEILGHWDVTTGARVGPRPVPDRPVIHVRFDGRAVVTGWPVGDRETVWDADTGRVTNVRPSSFGRIGVVGLNEGRYDTGNPRTAVEFNAGGRGVTRIIEKGTGAVLSSAQLDEALSDVLQQWAGMMQVAPGFAPLLTPDDGRWLLGEVGDARALWDMKTGRRLAEFDGGGHCFASPTGRLLVVVTPKPDGIGDPRVRVVDTPDGRTVADEYRRPESSTAAVAFSRDDRLIAVGESVGPVVVRDAKTGRAVARFRAEGRVAGLAFSPDGKTLAAATFGGPVTLWALPNGD